MFTLPLPLAPETWSVSDLNRYVRQALETDIRLQDVRVRGEVSGFKAYPSGHWYFTLKDGSAQISSVMWKQRAARQRYQPRDGDQVEAVGRVTLYEQRGQYQFDTALLEPVGQGALFAEFARLKSQLEAEGLFNAARKRPLPSDPRRIAIITSSSGAALQDMLNILRRRNPLVTVTLVPTPVQGDEAVPGVVAGLKRLRRLAAGTSDDRPDVIIVARGGGSLEDLWAFNDERVARALDTLRTTPVPVVSGVGHETDFTIADFVADVRAPTPSAAAELCSPITLEDRRRHIDDLSLQLGDLFEQQVQSGRVRLERARAALRAGSPFGQLALARSRLQAQSARLTATFTHQLRLERERLAGDVATLQAFSPLGVLERGYAIVRRPDGSVISRTSDVTPQQPLRIRVRDGEFDAKSL
ncbi:MAG: exodeoxyribonuclease VII large subunit [Anaerolineales bacterium]|nr:exodeoxyribonuclease VII large subunit [Anaerolineales bacterium]